MTAPGSARATRRVGRHWLQSRSRRPPPGRPMMVARSRHIAVSARALHDPPEGRIITGDVGDQKGTKAGIRFMQYRTLGRTGWSVGEIGYGMWGLAGWTGSDDQETMESLERAVQLGCNFFDSAWAYG